jgi:hypothetical protein
MWKMVLLASGSVPLMAWNRSFESSAWARVFTVTDASLGGGGLIFLQVKAALATHVAEVAEGPYWGVAVTLHSLLLELTCALVNTAEFITVVSPVGFGEAGTADEAIHPRCRRQQVCAVVGTEGQGHRQAARKFRHRFRPCFA